MFTEEREWIILQGIGEEKLPVFSDEQVAFIKYTSSLLPLVRKHEYIVIRELLNGAIAKSEIHLTMKQAIDNCSEEEVEHTLKFMLKKSAIKDIDGQWVLSAKLDDQFKDYMYDLLDYGLKRYASEYRNSDKFLLWHSYRMDQVQLKLLKDPDHNQLGTYVYGDNVIIFASLKKDASVEERLAYKDKFITANVFQWECENNISDEKLSSLRLSKYAHIFVRKVKEEHGVTLPFTYVGVGTLSNERIQEKVDSMTGKDNITFLYDIPMKYKLPDYLRYDFGVAQ